MCIYEFDKNSTEKIRVTIEEFKGSEYINIRVYFNSLQDKIPDWKPTIKGITLSLRLLPQLYKAIEKAMTTIKVGVE